MRKDCEIFVHCKKKIIYLKVFNEKDDIGAFQEEKKIHMRVT